MKIQKCYTKNSFKQAVALAKHEGHIFLGYTWDCACFKDLMIFRVYEEK